MSKNIAFASKSKKVSARIAALPAIITEIKNNSSRMNSYEEYITELRSELSIRLAEIAMGVSYGNKTLKDGNIESMIFLDAKPADLASLQKVNEVLIPFLNWEQKYLSNHSDWFANVPDDMSCEIPADPSHQFIGKLDKVNSKSATAYCARLSRILVDTTNLIEMAAVGEQIRKHRKLIECIIIGGVGVLLIGGIATAGILINKNRDDDINEEVEELPEDIDNIGDDNIELPELDTSDDFATAFAAVAV